VLSFKHGHHTLYKDLILENISDFTINGNNSTFSCIKPSLGIAIINVTNITIKNFHINQCSKDFTIDLKHKRRYTPLATKTALFINHSADVVITNISITVNNHTSGIIGINIFTCNLNKSSITNINVLGICENSTFNSVSGVVLYYNDNRNNFSKVVIEIQQFNYKTHGLCNNSYALRLIMMHKRYNVTMQIHDTNFSNLFNSSALLYYAESCRNSYQRSLLTFFNCKIYNNKGNKIVSMFLIEIHSHDNIFDITKSKYLCSKLANFIIFRKCDFVNNTNMNSLINILLKHNEQLNVFISITKCNISFNNDLQLINTDSELKLIKTLSYTITITGTNILLNSCAAKTRISLITVTSGSIVLRNSTIANNTNFENIIQLHSSLLRFQGFTKISGNCVRYIANGKEGTYYVYTEFSKVYVTENFVYLVSKTSVTYTKNFKSICTNQFITHKNKNLDHKFKNGTKLNFTVIQKNNMYTVPQYEINFLTQEHNEACVWLASTAFQTTKSTEVLNTIFDIERNYTNKSTIGKIPSSVCPCSSLNDFDCTKHEIGSIFPGQTLTIKLILPEIVSTKSENRYTTMMAKMYNSSKLGCQIFNAHEVSQTHLRHKCNKYNYTIWFNGNSSECELYLGTEGVPEIFYVNLMPCPIGFSLQHDKKGCYCDKTLNTNIIKITSCDLDDGTILHPGNSWLSGKVVNSSHTYKVSINCPFNYCLPNPSHLNLSNPNVQCQFNRSGLLCGHCQKVLALSLGHPNVKSVQIFTC